LVDAAVRGIAASGNEAGGLRLVEVMGEGRSFDAD
jgi:hypothetical protein